MDLTHLAEIFRGAVRADGKISPAWRRTHAEAGQALLNATGASSIAEAWFLVSNERPTCQTCGGPVTFSAKLRRYSRFCSARCGQLDPAVKLRRETTNLQRHQVRNAGGFGTEQHKQALLKRHGVDHPMSSEKIKRKLQDTNLQRHGSTNVFASSTIKRRIKATVQHRYGVDHVMQAPEVRQKHLENGQWKLLNGRDKAMAATLSTITDKVRQRLAAHDMTLLSTPTGFSYSHRHMVRHDTCGTTFESPIYSGSVPRCPTCDPLLHGTSWLEKQVASFIADLGFEVVTGTRPLNGKGIDILVPERSLGIEVNGLFWHSDSQRPDPHYHLNKTLEAQQLGITLLHLFEDDLVNRWPTVASMLRIKLGLGKKLAARKCDIRQVPLPQARAFCQQYHLRGTARATEAWGLYHSDQLVAVATFAPARYGNAGFTELIRFCSLHDTVVMGGLSRLISRVAGPLVSYADRSHSTGRAYYAAGFKLERTTAPNYWWFQPGGERVHQSQLRKYKLLRADPTLDSSLTEQELLRQAGWSRIWDCGQLVFTRPRINLK